MTTQLARQARSIGVAGPLVDGLVQASSAMVAYGSEGDTAVDDNEGELGYGGRGSCRQARCRWPTLAHAE